MMDSPASRYYAPGVEDAIAVLIDLGARNIAIHPDSITFTVNGKHGCLTGPKLRAAAAGRIDEARFAFEKARRGEPA